MARKTEKKLQTMRSTVRTLSIKCYEEQLEKGWEKTKEILRSINKSELQVLAIEHNKDTDTSDIWKPAYLKPHYHIIVRVLTKSPMRVESILRRCGVFFRKPEDENLWKEHGVETVGDFTSMAMYLTHETEKAQLDGKWVYDITEIVSNLDIEEIKQIREGYTRVSNAKRRVSNAEMAELDEIAKQLGREFGDFEEWRDSLPYIVRKNSGMKEIEKSYYRSAYKRIKELGTDILRLCVFIQGDPGEGKTYAAEHALEGKKTIVISESGTGQYDEVEPTVEAMIIDDQTVPDLKAVADNRRRQLHRRNGGRPWWCGQYLIVTYNLSFEEWLEDCGITKAKDVNAIRDRFYICHIEKLNGRNRLYLDKSSDRCTQKENDMKWEMFEEFRDKFEAIIMTHEKVIEQNKARVGFSKRRRKRMLWMPESLRLPNGKFKLAPSYIQKPVQPAIEDDDMPFT